MAVKYIDSGNDDGECFGQLATSLISFHGATPVDQAAAIADATAITGGESPTEAEHNALLAKVNSILAALREKGLIAT